MISYEDSDVNVTNMVVLMTPSNQGSYTAQSLCLSKSDQLTRSTGRESRTSCLLEDDIKNLPCQLIISGPEASHSSLLPF